MISFKNILSLVFATLTSFAARAETCVELLLADTLAKARAATTLADLKKWDGVPAAYSARDTEIYLFHEGTGARRYEYLYGSTSLIQIPVSSPGVIQNLSSYRWYLDLPPDIYRQTTQTLRFDIERTIDTSGQVFYSAMIMVFSPNCPMKLRLP